MVRKLANNKSIESGANSLIWDGRNDNGKVVPDEAYSIKIDITSNEGAISYFPAAAKLKEVTPDLAYYDRQNKIISYRLPKPSRVHAHAGSAVTDPITKQPVGPVLKTLINREARPAGLVIEHWTGYDESGTIYVPGLPNFAFSFSVSELPENSIITTGNRQVKFLDTIQSRIGFPLIKTGGGDHPHHRDLPVLDDVSPTMSLLPNKARWSDKDQAWIIVGNELVVQGRLEGPSAHNFAKLPGAMGIFINDKLVWRTESPEPSFRRSIRIDQLSNGIHYIAVNWGTQYGPLVTSAFRIKVQRTGKK